MILLGALETTFDLQFLLASELQKRDRKEWMTAYVKIKSIHHEVMGAA